jgi:glycosyltransferase involved in cell wall biosynthesis
MGTEGIAGDTLLFFGEDWGRHNSTGQYLAQVLGRDYRVIWWDSLGLRRPQFTPSDIGRIATKLLKFARGKRASRTNTDEAQPEVVTPLVVPYHGPLWIGRVNAFLIRTLAAKRDAYPPRIMIAACPAAADVMRHTPAALKVYYCADEYSSLPGMEPSLVSRLEQRLLDSVDLVVASSRTLLEEKSRLHGNVHYLPHGVDYDRFSQALQTTERPKELADLTRPIVGFVGIIDQYTDIELLEEMVRAIPDADFVFIGPSRVERLPRGENVHHLGPRPHESLYRYLAHFSVGIVPYRPGPFARHANPTKLREYLAAGVPVVSVPVPEARGISPHVEFAEDREQFVASVRARVSSPPGSREREQISGTVADQSWLCRGNALQEMIRSELGSSSETRETAPTANTV